MSDIYANAADSLRIGIEHFLKEPGYSSRKHAILTLFHAIEWFLKEQLHRTNPILIYRNLDAKITDASMTVGIKEALTRLENLGLGLPKQPQEVIERIQNDGTTLSTIATIIKKKVKLLSRSCSPSFCSSQMVC